MPVLWRDRIGVAYLPGLDRPEVMVLLLQKLAGQGYRLAKEWPMVDGWAVFEMVRDRKKFH